MAKGNVDEYHKEKYFLKKKKLLQILKINKSL